MTNLLKKTTGYIASAKLSVTCLLLMAVIVFWGTLYQSSEGLFAARERFFQSWFVLTRFSIPFPGMKLISLALLLNVIFSSLRFFKKPLKYSGLILIHSGLALFLAVILFSSRFTQEYYLPLREGQEVSSAYSTEQFEIASFRTIFSQSSFVIDSIPVASLKKDQEIVFPNTGMKFKVRSVGRIKESHDGQENIQGCQAALIIDELCNFRFEKEVVLKSNEQPFSYICGFDTVLVSMRHSAVPLPVNLKLIDFHGKFYPGTKTLKKVESQILVSSDKLVREVKVSMNKPFRHGSYTFYQASFSNDGGNEAVNISVVYNPYRLFPYTASILMIAGFIIHLLLLVIWRSKSEPGHISDGK